MAHRDDAEGKIRTRRLFSDINKNAVAVSEGDKVVIDEDDPCAIVTRRIYAGFKHFRNGEEIAVTGKKEQVSKDGREYFTSLLSLYTVCKKLKGLHKRPKGTLEHDPRNVEAIHKITTEFLEFAIENEPSLREYFIKRSTTLEKQRENNRSLFFRPVGLEILARAYAYFSARGKLPALRGSLANLKFDNPHGIYDGLLWNAGRIEARARAKVAAFELLLYLMGELGRDAEGKLLEKIRELTKNKDYLLPERHLAGAANRRSGLPGQ